MGDKPTSFFQKVIQKRLSFLLNVRIAITLFKVLLRKKTYIIRNFTMVCPPSSMFCTVISLRYCQGGPVLPCKAKTQELLALQSSVRVQQYGTSQQTRYIEPLLVQCSPAVYDVGPTMNEQWLNVSCLWDSWWLTCIFVLKYGNVCQMGLCHSAVFSLLLYDNIGIQSQNVVTAYLKSKQLLHFLL